MKPRFTFILLSLCLLGFLQQANAQRQTDNWFFGNRASLEFSGNTPASFLNSVMIAPEGSASISDRNGNLLFYTDGQTIWNRLHQTMTNGANLTGLNSATQSALIVPQPGNDSIYYVFTTSEYLNGAPSAGMFYSVVNMNAQNGNGEVLAGSKNISLTGSGSFSEKIAGVHHFNNQDVWVITHRFPAAGTQEFLAYKVTSAGVATTPVASAMPTFATLSGGGYLKASPVGTHLAAGYTNEGLQLFDFDNKTGVVSNPQTLFQWTFALNSNSHYGVEFSPDGRKLYTVYKSNINSSTIFQYNLDAGSLADMISTRQTIANYSTPIATGTFMAMQLARNGKIYVARANTNLLSEITNPNALGSASDFRSSAIVLPSQALAASTFHGFGLPNFIQSYFAPPKFTFAGVCAESPTVFTLVNPSAADSVRWDFGDPGSGNLNVSKQLQPSHTYLLPGTYPVKLTIFSQGLSAVYELSVTIRNKPLVSLGKDTTICEGATINLASTYPHSPFNERFLWSTGDTVAAIVVPAGIYWLELTNGQCTTRDSIIVSSRPAPKVDLGPPVNSCSNAPITLDAGNPGATYLWQPGGETTQTITVNTSGVYRVTVSAFGCTVTGTKNVTIYGLEAFSLGDDITACEGEAVVLDYKGDLPPFTTIFWNDSVNGRQLRVTKPGKYWLKTSRGNCSYTDTINVYFKPCPPPPPPFISNLVTPNGDNLNDYLIIKDLGEGTWNVRIYNRWGMQVYQKDDYQNTWPEKKLSAGTYYYIFENNKTKKLFKGWVELTD